jgi:hypothetical protein
MWEGFEHKDGSIGWKYYELFSSGNKNYLRYKIRISDNDWVVIEFKENKAFVNDNRGNSNSLDDAFKKAVRAFKKFSDIEPPDRNKYKKVRTPEQEKEVAKRFRAQRLELPGEGYYPDLLLPPSGNEKGREVYDGIAHYKSPGVHRLVYYVDGKAISGLTLRVTKKWKNQRSATIDKVYTDSKYRRRGHARELFKYAKEIYRKVKHSKDLTDIGKKWKRGVHEMLINDLKKISEHKSPTRRKEILFNKMIEYIDDSEFIGLHCQGRPRSRRGKEDSIGHSGIHAQDIDYGFYFPEILDSLDFSIKDKAEELGLMDVPDKDFDDNYDEWYEQCVDFFEKHKIRWIFVTKTRFLDRYGKYKYIVCLDDRAVYTVLDGGEEDNSELYVYNAKMTAPHVVHVEKEMEEHVEDYIRTGDKPNFSGKEDGDWY